jgi:hypothetical protein
MCDPHMIHIITNRLHIVYTSYTHRIHIVYTTSIIVLRAVPAPRAAPGRGSILECCRLVGHCRAAAERRCCRSVSGRCQAGVCICVFVLVCVCVYVLTCGWVYTCHVCVHVCKILRVSASLCVLHSLVNKIFHLYI